MAIAGAGITQSICLPLLSIYQLSTNGTTQVRTRGAWIGQTGVPVGQHSHPLVLHLPQKSLYLVAYPQCASGMTPLTYGKRNSHS